MNFNVHTKICKISSALNALFWHLDNIMVESNHTATATTKDEVLRFYSPCFETPLPFLPNNTKPSNPIHGHHPQVKNNGANRNQPKCLFWLR